jgi:signal transduction histidine kinase
MASRDNLPSARLELLLQASEILGRSFDFTATLTNLATILVPRLADGYAVDLVDEDGSIRRIAAVHADPAMAPLCQRLMTLGKFNPNAPEGIQRILAAGTPRLTEHVTDETLQAGARDPEHLAILRALEPNSMIVVPLKAHDRSIGLLWLYYSKRTKRVYRAPDLAFVEEIAARAALAIENARLWRESQEAIEARDEFLSIASHELRTPLTSMLLVVQGELRKLQKDPSYLPPRAEIETWLATFNRQTARLSHLVSEMLDASQMTSGTLELLPEEVDLGDVVREATLALGEDARKRGCIVSIDAPPGIVGWWDPARIVQVVAALLSNAIKYGSGKPVAVEVRSVGDRAEIIVTDQGIGIEREHLSRIFARFERQVSHRNYGGFGLGLWLARQLVEASGGTIKVTSDLGHGAAFLVDLPRGTPRTAATGAENAASAAGPR